MNSLLNMPSGSVVESIVHTIPENVIYLSQSEDMDDVKHYFSEDESIQAFVFPKYYKVYKRRVTGSMVKALAYLYKWNKQNGMKEWCKLADYLIQMKLPSAICTGDNVKLRYWGLLELKSEVDGTIREDGSNKVGLMRITDKGILFLKGEIAIDEFLYVCNKKIIGSSKTITTVDKCVKNKFNYQEIFN